MGHLRQNWPTLLRPARLESDNPERVARFVCEPLEHDFADELGKSLRHALLHSLPGTAIVGVRARLDGIEPPWSWLNTLALNLSHLALGDCDAAKTISIGVPAGTIMRASTLASAGLRVVDPAQQLCIVGRRLVLDLWIERGYGMRLSASPSAGLPADVTAVDAFFGPVLRADCFTERPSVGAWADCDRLMIDIETNGAMSPHEALWAAVRVLTAPDRRLAA
jgi:DNA-directed RNA polymerase subunit alpha